MNYIFYSFTLLWSVALFGVHAEHPQGHLQRIGSHMPPIEIEIKDNIPNPVEFFEYVRSSIPVVLKGAAAVLPNFQTWKDDEYLMKKYGLRILTVEEGKYEGSIFGKYRTMLFARFLKSYKEKPYYIIEAINSGHPILQDIALPKSISCGGYKENMLRLLFLFSSGNTSSALHIDSVDNLHCLLDGWKDWVMYDRQYIQMIPTMEGQPAYGAMDARSVDMYKYPIMKYLPWHHARLEAGDCLFVPPGWYHHVKSSDSRNMALAYWISHMHVLTDLEDCPKSFADLEEYRPINNFNMSKYYVSRSSLWSIFIDMPDVMEKDFFQTACADVLQGDCAAVAAGLDVNGDGIITADEVTNMPPELAEDNIFDDRYQEAYGDAKPKNKIEKVEKEKNTSQDEPKQEL